MITFSTLSDLSNYVSEQYSFDKKLEYEEKINLANFIIKRSNLKHSYSGLYSPYPEEISNGVRIVYR